MNEALMGILRVSNLSSPPYISVEPSLKFHRVSTGDRFVLMASDGLFDFFSNAEAVELVSSFVISSPLGNPAEFIVEQLVLRASKKAGMCMKSKAQSYSFLLLQMNAYSITYFRNSPLMKFAECDHHSSYM